jgi:glyoxylase-like metal-dependent hydrolase (beta-lactamase superfamily II)
MTPALPRDAQHRLRRLADGVWMSTSRRGLTTSTLVTGPDSEALLVDPSWEADELAALGDELTELGVVPTAGLATHAHFDHVLWHPSFGGAPRWASAETCRRAEAERERGLANLGPGWPADLAALYGQLTPLTGGRLPWDGPVVELLIHDGHCPGHTAAWLPDRRLLLVGDMLSDVELPLPSEQPGGLDAYVSGLDLLAPYARAAALLIPGHGTPTSDGAARLDADRRYLDDVLAGRASSDPRLDNTGMAEVYRATVALVAGRNDPGV